MAKQLSEDDKVMAAGVAVALGSVVYVLHNRGVIRCPGFGPDAPVSAFHFAATLAVNAMIADLEKFALENPLSGKA